jgi:hypothetical protein
MINKPVGMFFEIRQALVSILREIAFTKGELRNGRVKKLNITPSLHAETSKSGDGAGEIFRES